MAVRNTGAEADRLIGGAADFSAEVQVHEI